MELNLSFNRPWNMYFMVDLDHSVKNYQLIIPDIGFMRQKNGEFHTASEAEYLSRFILTG